MHPNKVSRTIYVPTSRAENAPPLSARAPFPAPLFPVPHAVGRQRTLMSYKSFGWEEIQRAGNESSEEKGKEEEKCHGVVAGTRDGDSGRLVAAAVFVVVNAERAVDVIQCRTVKKGTLLLMA